MLCMCVDSFWGNKVMMDLPLWYILSNGSGYGALESLVTCWLAQRGSL